MKESVKHAVVAQYERDSFEQSFMNNNTKNNTQKDYAQGADLHIVVCKQKTAISCVLSSLFCILKRLLYLFYTDFIPINSFRANIEKIA